MTILRKLFWLSVVLGGLMVLLLLLGFTSAVLVNQLLAHAKASINVSELATQQTSLLADYLHTQEERPLAQLKTLNQGVQQALAGTLSDVVLRQRSLPTELTAISANTEELASLLDQLEVAQTTKPAAVPSLASQALLVAQSTSTEAQLFADQQLKLLSRLETVLVVVLTGVIILGIGTLLAAVRILRRVWQTLQRFHAGTVKIAAGELSHQLSINDRGELGEIAQAFNTMASKVRDSHAELTKQVEQRTQALQATQAQTEAILNDMAQGVVAVDQQGHILFINIVACDLLGQTAASLTGQHFTELGLHDTADHPVAAAEHPLQQVLTDPTSHVEAHYGHYRYYAQSATANPVPLSVAASAVHLNDQGVIGAVIIFQDASEEQRISQAKTDFVSLASHQLRTPLSAVNWYTELLLQELTGQAQTESLQRYVEKIQLGTQRMISLINDLLNVSRLELGTFSFQPEPLPITALLQSVIDEFKPQLTTKQLHLELELPDQAAEVVLDEQLVRIVFQNLLSNAIKYTPNQGHITVTFALEATVATLTVQDTGIGIPANQQDKLFTRFFRAENGQRIDMTGTGLGLHLTRAFVQQAGGDVHFSSEENVGSTFTVTFPLA